MAANAAWRDAWLNVQDLLCVRLDSIGDVLMTTPAIRALKESNPARRITLLTSSAGAEIAPLVPEIDRVIIYDAPWLKATAPRRSSLPEYAMIGRLRRGEFDGAVIFTVYSQSPLPSAFLCYMADIPRRLAHCRENPYQLLTNWVPDPEPDRTLRHEVQRQLDLVSEIGCNTEDTSLSLHVPDRARIYVRHLLREMGLDLTRPWAVIHPGATAPSRRYPWESFAKVAHLLVTECGWQVVFTGTQPELELVENIRVVMAVSSCSLAGCLSVEEMAALVSLAPIVIASNSGPVHIAAAVGTPVVDLYALTNPQHTPWGVPNRVLSYDVPCKYCYKSVCPQGHHDCLRLIQPEAVVEAATSLFAETWAGHQSNAPADL